MRFIALTGLFALGLGACDPARAPLAGARPNIVFVLADDLGWKDVGYEGSAYATPEIDRLAAGGMVFTRAYAASPSCSPTRASILTGRHPARIGLTRAIRNRDLIENQRDQRQGEEVTDEDKPKLRLLPPESLAYLPLEEETFATRLTRAGYATGFVGKWHLGLPPHTPKKHGFADTRAVGYFSASPYFPPYQIPDLEPRAADEYLTDRLTDEAVDFLATAPEPFVLFLSHFAVHGPWQARQDRIASSRDALASARSGRAGEQSNAVYGAMISSLDESVGRVVAALGERGVAERTLVVFTSDNGPTLEKEGEITTTAPLRGGKLELYEGGLRVPTVIYWPGVVEPARSGVPISSVDYFPTLLSLAGVQPDPSIPLDGLDLVPLLEGAGLTSASSLGRDALYFHAPHREPACAILREDEKLIHYFDDRSELYDLAADQGESVDLASTHPERAEDLRAELFDWLAEVGAELPRPNPHYDPDG